MSERPEIDRFLSPRLVASTNANREPPFTGLRHFVSRERLIAPLPDHPIAAIWLPKVVPMVLAMINAMEIPMSHVDFLRMYRPEDLLPTVEEQEAAAPHIVFVGIVKQEVDPAVAEAFTDQCRANLQSLGIDDVHVEVHVSSFELLAGPLLPAHPSVHLQHLSPEGRSTLRRHELAFRLGVGSEIALSSKQGMRGSAGIFLKIAGHEGTFLLTSRHVVRPSNSESDRRAFHDESSGDEITLLCNTTYDRLSNELDSARDTAKRDLDRRAEVLQELEDENQPLPNAKTAKKKRQKQRKTMSELEKEIDRLAVKLAPTPHQVAKVAHSAAEALHSELDKLVHLLHGENSAADRRHTHNRVIGRIEFHPPAVSDSSWNSSPNPRLASSQLSYSDDWALIEVDETFLPDGQSPNVVELDSSMRKKYGPLAEPMFQPQLDVLSDDGLTIRLRGLGSSTELQGKSTPVMKRGAVTRTTYGTASPIPSVVRRMTRTNEDGTKADRKVDSLAIPIYDHGDLPFAKGGDSGSAIVDERGMVIGIIFGGNTDSDRKDVTYVTPIDFILHRMQTVHGLEATLA